jgi:signal transduction histidine kinase
MGVSVFLCIYAVYIYLLGYALPRTSAVAAAGGPMDLAGISDSGSVRASVIGGFSLPLRSGSSLSRKGVLFLLIPGMFQLLVMAILLRLDHSYEAAHKLQLRSTRITTTGHELLTLLVDAETGMRGYALTGNAVFLQPYVSAQIKLPSEMDTLHRYSSGPPPAGSEDVEQRATEVLAYHKLIRGWIAAGERARAVESIARQEGKRLMDREREAMAVFLAANERGAREREARAAEARNRFIIAVGAASAIEIGLTIALAMLFARGIAYRLRILVENTQRLESGEPLHETIDGNDEIAELDRRFHDMAATLARNDRELRDVNSDLESFSYSVSHDLRAPLRAVNGYAQMLEEDYGQSFDDEARRFVSVIRSEAQRMGTLIDALLSFSRLGKRDVARSPVDMTALARQVFAGIGAPARFISEEAPPASGEPAMLRQVLENLLGNAVKFSRNASAPLIEFGGRGEGELNTYWVRDNGTGFDMRHADRLFGIFQRLHTDDEYEGTGVGLAIVHRIVTRHGGRVWAESKPGQGATFYFSLPAADVEERKVAS